tara:strand:- start:989 stop:1546 length:558 start_codon:yes stop_codon:yes gene_type:complete
MSIKLTALNTIRTLTEISNQYQIEEKITNISEEIRKNSLQGKFTLIFGNGGSAADAQHFVGELVCTYKSRKRNPYKAIALTSDTAIITAWANDFEYESIFKRQIEAFGESAGFIIGLSTSGKSKNVIQALNYARNNNITTCLISGDNKLEFENYDFMIKIPSKDTATIQTVTQVIYHSICDLLEV